MATDIKLPELGEGVTEGELIKWLVKPGDTIKPDQAVAEIMTDKATVEVPSPIAGTVKELKFKAGDIIKVESVILTADAAGATSTKSQSTHKTPEVSAMAAKSAPAAQMATASAGGAEKSVKLPELGEGVTEGELVKWLVKPGDSVKADQAIAEIMTDKATVEVPSPFAGTVGELKFKTGDIIKVESVLLTMKTSGGGASTNSTSSTKVPTPAQQQFEDHSPTQTPLTMSSTALTSHAPATTFSPPVADSKVLATPATRRLAREMGVDINGLTGTGLAGRVTREDVMNKQGSAPSTSASGATAASSPSFKFPTPQPYSSSRADMEERVDMRGIRKKIAENMQMAKAVIPHFTLMDEVDVTELVKFRESLKDYADKNQTKITYLPFVMKALIATIKEFPAFNASIDDAASQIVYKKYFNIGFAADTPNGLVVPVIKNADHKTILDISKEIVDLSKRARENKLKPDEMKGATITITNIGSVGGMYATPIINHPEVAILGMYKIQDKPVILNGQLAAIKVMNYTITCDHRLIDGAVAANFLRAFFQKIQNPAVLMMNMM